MSGTTLAPLALQVFLITMLVYNANGRLITTGDAYPARSIPFALWLHGTLSLDPVDDLVTQGHPTPYWKMRTMDGETGSLYPIVIPVLITPLYGPAVYIGSVLGWTPERLTAAALVMEKFAATLLASLSVVFFWLAATKAAGGTTAWRVTMAYAFATATWTISSQGLWSHGLSELLVSAALMLVLSRATKPSALLLGIALGLLVANRPQNLFLATGLGLFAWSWSKPVDARAEVVLGALMGASPFIAYNIWTFGHPAGAYAVAVPNAFSQSPGLVTGLAGLLVSPARGLFIFSPWLLVVPLGVKALWRRAEYRYLVLCLCGAVVCQTLLYVSFDWRAGHSYGPRFMVDMTPILAFFTIPVMREASGYRRIALAALVLFSVWVQVIGAWRYTGASNVLYSSTPNWSSAWIPANTQWILESRNPLQSPHLIDDLKRFVTSDSTR